MLLFGEGFSRGRLVLRNAVRAPACDHEPARRGSRADVPAGEDGGDASGSAAVENKDEGQEEEQQQEEEQEEGACSDESHLRPAIVKLVSEMCPAKHAATRCERARGTTTGND